MAHQFYSAAIRYARQDELAQHSADLIERLDHDFSLRADKRATTLHGSMRIFENPEGTLYLSLTEPGIYEKDFVAMGQESDVERLIQSLREFYTERGYHPLNEPLPPEEQAARLRTLFDEPEY